MTDAIIRTVLSLAVFLSYNAAKLPHAMMNRYLKRINLYS